MKYLITLIILAAFAHTDAAWAYSVRLNIEKMAFADTQKVVKKQSVSVGANYGTDDSFFGRTSPSRYPFLSTDAIYNSKNGLFVYTSLWKVLGSAPTIDEVDFGGGYSHRFSKEIKADVSYTHFFFNSASPIIRSSAKNEVDLNSTYNWKFLKTSATLDYLLGKATDFFVTINNSRYFESNWSIFDDKDYLTFEPTFSLIFGTQNFVQNFSMYHDFNNNPNNHTPPMPNDPGHYDDDAGKNSRFNLLNYSLKIPLAYNRPHYTLEASYKYAIPVNVQGAVLNHHESFFNLTFYYVFFK